MFSHMMVGSNDIARSKVFYDALFAAVGGPDVTYPAKSPNVNPWRYAYPGTSNPDSYDLWMQLSIGGKTYLLCNWSKQVQINSPLP